MKFDVVSFGSAVIDTFVDTNVAENHGEICYRVGSKILIKKLRFDIGGGGTNTAVAFARFGLRTGFVGNLGSDENAEMILNYLRKEKVKFLGSRLKKQVSGYSVILDSKENNRTILTFKGVNDSVELKNLKTFKTRWLYYSSLLGKSFKTQSKLAEKMVGAGVKLAFNPSEYLIKRKNIFPLLKLTNILIVNKEEARLLAGKSKNFLKSLYGLGPSIVVVTDKNKIIQAYDGEKIYTLKPHLIKVVERTGAGDAFASGFVAGQIIGLKIKDSLRLGLRESESVIKHFGAKNNLLHLNLKKLIKKNG